MQKKVLTVMAVALMAIGCNHAGVEARSTVGATQVHVKGTTTHPEWAIDATARFVQRTTAAQTEQTLVQQGRRPYYGGGCYGNQCWRHYGRYGMAPLSTGRAPAAPATTQKAEQDRTAEMERLRKEAADAKKAKEEALDALQSAVNAAESTSTPEASDPPAPE